MTSSASFVFATCQLGAEPTLKRDVQAHHPELHFAYSQPGFLTFKQVEGASPDTLVLQSPFARTFGRSVGPQASAESLLKQAVALRGMGPALRLHVFERDRHRPGEFPPAEVEGALAHSVERVLREQAPAGLFAEGIKAQVGEKVLDVVVAPGEPLWLGVHQHSSAHAAYPGGIPPVELPQPLPSRAYRKLEEALFWFELPVRTGDLAVELGCAPGGATYALLRRGVRVVGVDPNPLDPMVATYVGPSGVRVRYLPKNMGELRREELPKRVDWLILDVNLAASVALHGLHRLADKLRPTLRGMILTLKLNRWADAEQLPRWLNRLEAMGLVQPRAQQLYSNRQELCVVGLTERGLQRLEEEG